MRLHVLHGHGHSFTVPLQLLSWKPLMPPFDFLLLTRCMFHYLIFFFFLNDPAPTEFSPLPPHAALPIPGATVKKKIPSPRKTQPDTGRQHPSLPASS